MVDVQSICGRDAVAPFADLHTHTEYSDGTERIETVLERAVACGLKAVAITDHDTVDHWDEVRRTSERLGVEAVRGVEMSCYDDRFHKKIHLLGLWLADEVPHVGALCAETLRCRDRYHRTLISELAERGFDISYDSVAQIAPHGTIFKMHIYEALKRRYPDEMTPQRYREMFAGKTSYEVDRQMGYIPIDAGIEAVIADGGIPVLAHPCEYDNYAQIPDYVEMGLRGVEISHPLMHADDYRKTLELARQFNLACSGGSDFHNADLTPYLGNFGLLEHQFVALKEQAKR